MDESIKRATERLQDLEDAQEISDEPWEFAEDIRALKEYLSELKRRHAARAFGVE